MLTEQQCDLRKDSCSQCIRAGLACSGYRDTAQLRIRDESQTTKQKALIRRSKGIPQTVTIAIEDMARNAFFAHYVYGFSSAYDVLGSLHDHFALNTHLAASVDAVSLAFFCFQFEHARTSLLARQKYSYALPLLNKELRSPDSATSDSTLLAVLLLDLFEKISNNNPRSTSSWMSHVNGALALVKMRGTKQFHDYPGRRLSLRLTTSLLISCVAANAPVPHELIKLRSDLEPFLDRADPKWKVSGLVVKYANLQGAIQDGCLNGSNILTRAAQLDCEFVSLAETMPLTWLYNTTYLEEASERVLEQRFDTYPHHHTTQIWNVLRIMRLLLIDTIRTYSDGGSRTSLSEAPDNTIETLVKEICATAPQYCGYPNAIPETETPSTIHRLRCYTLLFPLYVAGLYASPTTMIKPWVINQLQFMANEIGIRNAGVVAKILERGDGTSPWDVYAILGSYAIAA